MSRGGGVIFKTEIFLRGCYSSMKRMFLRTQIAYILEGVLVVHILEGVLLENENLCTKRHENLCTKRHENVCTKRHENVCTKRHDNVCTKRHENVCTKRHSGVALPTCTRLCMYGHVPVDDTRIKCCCTCESRVMYL